MSDDAEILVELLTDIFGKAKNPYESKGPIALDCPVCDDGKHKGNMEVNYFKHVYHCWSCGDINYTHGTLNKLIKKYGTKKQQKIYQVLAPEENVTFEKPISTKNYYDMY